MKLKDLLEKLNEIKAEYGDEMHVILDDKQKKHHVYANNVVYCQDVGGYVMNDTVWIEGE